MAAPAGAPYFSAKSPDDSGLSKSEITTTASPQRELRVVLLDDEPSILKTWHAILEAHNIEPVVCQRAEDALMAIARGCDCVLTDYHMPDMTGIEVILAGKLLTRAQFIVMTGNDSPKLHAAATAAGAACVLSKPAPIKGVLEIIEKLCGKEDAGRRA